MKIAELKTKVVNFVKENKWTLARLGVVALAAGIVPEVSYAQNTTTSTVTTITGPLTTMQNLMTGPVPTAITTIGAAVGGASWAMNIENQITKTAMRVVGGGAVALGAAGFISQTAGFLIP